VVPNLKHLTNLLLSSVTGDTAKYLGLDCITISTVTNLRHFLTISDDVPRIDMVARFAVTVSITWEADKEPRKAYKRPLYYLPSAHPLLSALANMRSLITAALVLLQASLGAMALPQITGTTGFPTGTCFPVTVTQTTTPAWPTGPQPGGGVRGRLFAICSYDGLLT